MCRSLELGSEESSGLYGIRCMGGDESVTFWIEQLRDGNEDAPQELWNRYYPRLTELALRRLRGSSRRVADEEDVVAGALQSFFTRARDGQFPELQDRHQLWYLLIRITERKALKQIRDLNRKKRGDGRVVGESGMPAGSSRSDAIMHVADVQPTPDMAVAVDDAMEHLLEALDDDELVDIATKRLEGLSVAEISDDIGRSVATVERRLNLIRNRWRRILSQDES